MSDMLDRMAQLRAERVARLAALHENTIAMRRVADEAQRAGNTPYRIAQLLGVTNRTVYLWLKK